MQYFYHISSKKSTLNHCPDFGEYYSALACLDEARSILVSIFLPDMDHHHLPFGHTAASMGGEGASQFCSGSVASGDVPEQ